MGVWITEQVVVKLDCKDMSDKQDISDPSDCTTTNGPLLDAESVLSVCVPLFS